MFARRISLEGRRYRVRFWWEASGAERASDDILCGALVDESCRSTISLTLDELRGAPAAPCAAEAIIEELRASLRAGLLRLELEPAPSYRFHGAIPRRETDEPRESAPPREELTWIEIEVIGERGLRVPSAELTVSLPNGETRVQRIAEGERFRADAIPKGACHVSLGAPIDLEPPAGPERDYEILVPHDRATSISLATTRLHTIAVSAPRALVVELTDAGFETGGCLLRPDSREVEASEGPRTSGLLSIAAALDRAFEDPSLRLWVVGHADTVGGDGDNLVLSLDRALNVQLFTAGKCEAWASHCQTYYTVGDFEAAYRFVAHTFDWDCDPGSVDDDFDDASRDARDRFRQRYAELTGIELARHVKQNEADWRAIFDMYSRALADAMGMTAGELAGKQSELRFVEPSYEGCGELYPKEAPDQDGFESLANRRVDIVLVRESDVRYLLSPADAARIYAPDRLFRRVHVHVPGASGALGEYVSQLVDTDGHPVPFERYELELPGGGVIEGRGDAQGFVRVSGVPIGTCRIVYPDIDAREWEAEVIGPRIVPAMPPFDEDPEEEIADPEPSLGEGEHDHDDDHDDEDLDEDED
jgi:hypothetical protein